MLPPGSRFAGFTLIAPLGRGAQGEVHRARSPQGHEVALKILRQELADAEAAGRFRREMTLLPNLHHPNVLCCVATGEAEGRLWIATDLAQGTLRDHLRQTPCMSGPAVLDLGVQLAAGLRAIADAGLVHRDIKPTNILEHNGRWLVADLGLARSLLSNASRYTGTGLMVGTPNYLAPEVIDGEEPSLASDCYGLGCVLFECVMGHVPFRGVDELHTLRLHLQGDVPEMPGVDRALADLVRGLLTKKPAQRLQTLEALCKREQTLASPADFPATIPDGAQMPFPETLPDRSESLISTATLVRPPQRLLPTLSGQTLGDSSRVLQRVRLDLCRSDRHQVLFVYAKPELCAGRENLANPTQDLCLRLLPGQAFADANRRISNQHCRFGCDQEGAWIVDTNSSHGTRVNGVVLTQGERKSIAGGTDIILADVMNLRAETLTEGGRVQALWLRRVGNADHISYLLVIGRVQLPEDLGAIVLDGRQGFICDKDGMPLHPGQRLADGTTIVVHAVTSEDQKQP